ncbi:MAG: [FeFe] hydrogenase H-cluster radical SAM maturase HydG [Candidatus Gastranaerophilales bacterium]|nr:[FeFe] hydrogenase H-cluster radical SAM maturase HydG [Candidatus Gastranaerophilales bacterium]
MDTLIKNNTFIDEDKINDLISKKTVLKERANEILNKAMLANGLTLEESAELLNIEDEEILEKLFKAAKIIKEKIYGKRIVLFAPLYASNVCTNNCVYCAFRRDNKNIERKILTPAEVVEEAKAIMRMGHKRIILLTGEDYKDTGLDYLQEIMDRIYKAKELNGEIRRINVNIAPLSVEDFKRLNTFGIGTYQVFQETYHKETYVKVHPSGKKANYEWRLEAMDRAIEAGINDLGIGPLFGLADYKFETLATLMHAEYMDKIGVGPHTISVPRIEHAQGVEFSDNPPAQMSDRDFKKLVSVIRLAVPYTGMVLSTRETPQLRREIIELGISQISAASQTNPGGYHVYKSATSQFKTGDNRSLEDMVVELCEHGFLPSFCTSCYRVGRVGRKFMEHAKTGHIHTYCEPNALATFKEYLLDYAAEKTKLLGEKVIAQHLTEIEEPEMQELAKKQLNAIIQGKRDLHV